MSQSDNIGLTGVAGSLRGRLQKGGVLVLGGFGAVQILRLASNLILTRLLAPEAFGLIAAAVSINVLAVMITDIGIHSSIVRSPHAQDKAFLRTAWTIKILRNLVVWTIIMISTGAVVVMAANGATPATSIFADPRLPYIMFLCSLQIIIGAFESVNKSVSERNLTIGRNIFQEVSAQLLIATVTVTCALNGLGVWSLPAGILAGATYNTILSHFLYPGPSMGLHWDRAHAGEILHFGKWLVLASFFGFATNKGDHLIFGWALESAHFGLYAIAAIWIGIAVYLLEAIIKRLFFPAISEVMRDRPENTARAYRQARLFLDAGAVAIAFGIFLFADLVFGVLYPDDFQGVSYFFKLLAPIALFAPYRMLSFMILSSGDSKSFTLVSFSTGAAMLTLTPLVIVSFGEKAGIIVFACIASAALPMLWKIARKIMPLDWRVEGRMLIAAVFLIMLLIGMPAPASLGALN